MPSSFRLLIVTVRYFPLMGGIETHVYEVGRRMVQAGLDVTILTTDPTHQMPPTEEVEGMHIRRVLAYPKNKDYYFAPGIWPVITQGKWDLVHFQGCHTLVPLLGMLAARKAGLPYILSFHTGGHSTDWRNQIRTAQWHILKPLLAHARHLIGVSQFEADYFRDLLHLPGEKFSVIRNGGQLPQLAEPVEPDPNLIVSIGRLERYKGHHRLIAALPFIRQQKPNARLLIIGGGPYENMLYQMIRERNLEEAVEIRTIPIAERQTMARTLASASVVTLLSDYEAHPIAVMEALALKRPVLVMDTSGLRELAQQGLVRSVEFNSTPQEIAQAVIREIDSPLPPLAQIEFPNWENCTAALLEVYRKVTGRKV